MLLALFCGICVSDYAAAAEWYGRLLGAEPSFIPNDIEAVWNRADDRSIYIVVRPEGAGHSVVAIFVDDLDERVAGIAERGIEPTKQETYDNGVRKVVYRDPDGNEVGFGAAASVSNAGVLVGLAEPLLCRSSMERGHRTLRIVGKGNKPAVIPLVPRTARTIDLAVGERCEGPIRWPATGPQDRTSLGALDRCVAQLASR